MSVTLQIIPEKALFRPGEKLAGLAEWEVETEVRPVEARLIWFTSGKGTQDVTIVDRRHWETMAQRGREKFEFTLPQAPHSFSGKLISLDWAIELVIEKSKESQRVEFVLSPFEKEIELRLAEDAS